jgi:hypothetical protein
LESGDQEAGGDDPSRTNLFSYSDSVEAKNNTGREEEELGLRLHCFPEVVIPINLS